ncbi:hypothetical protein [Reichenbachiella sp.]|uniref:hypothetical protein n=1 Tax=Reichenbachiella sp. TaxID=2184521 RepID=UPI003B599BA8
MIDYVKLRLPLYCLIYLEEKFEFELRVNEKTGEEYDTKTVKWRSLVIRIIARCFIEIRGSLHKHWNGNNYDDFTVSECIETVRKLCLELRVNPKDVQVANLEFGSNIQLPFSPKVILESVLFYKKRLFMSLSKSAKNEIGRSVFLSQMGLKMYDKGAQSNFPEDHPLIRFEVKIMRMQYLTGGGILTLDLLLDQSFYSGLKYRLLKTWNYVDLADDSLLSLLKTEDQKEFIINWYNPRYTAKLLRNDPEVFNIEYKRFRRLVKRYSNEECIKNQMNRLLKEKCEELLNN